MMKHSIIPVMIFCLLISSCEDIFFEDEPANTPIGNFESLWQTFDEKYAVFEQRNVDWDQQYAFYRPQVNPNTSEDQLYNILTNMMAALDDGHVSLMAPGRAIFSAKEDFRTQNGANLFDLGMLVRVYLNNDFQQINNQLIYGMTESNIGYLFINHLSDPIDIDAILKELENAEALVIDIRHNGGGDFTNGEKVASRFCDRKRLAFTGQPKSGPGKDEFGPITSYFLEPSGNQFDGPVALLTSRFTISAAENLTMYFNILPQVTVFGEATAGAMGERIEKEMPNGWIYSITGQVIKAADGVSYEGPGIPPDVFFQNKIEDVENEIDSLFITAVNHLKAQL